jgi:two-component system, OmpR family, KDP operon response regulator KdpE
VTRPYIMVIIDEPALKELFRINLSVRGYDVLDIPGCVKSVSIAEKSKPDLVIIDLMIAEVDGFDICKQICKLDIAPVIAFNMRGGDADLLRCFELGVDDYIGKPFGVDELMARINAVLRHKRFTGKSISENMIERSKL